MEAKKNSPQLDKIHSKSRFIYILDAGHGGVKNGIYQTRGKRSPIWEDGSVYYEGEGNRQIVAKVAIELDKLSVDYAFTVNPENPVDVSLKDRVHFANKLPYKNKVGISVHSNGHSNEKAKGWEVFTSPGVTQSDKMATIFYDKFRAKFPDNKFRKDTKDGDVDKEANFYIIARSVCPFILLENFFMTNKEECDLLMSEKGQNKIVDAIVESIVYIEKHGIK